MLRKHFLYDVHGEITNILHLNKAEIGFEHEGIQHCALLSKNRFYHNGKPIPNDDLLMNYVRINMKVKFSCHQFDSHQQSQEFNDFTYNWYATTCWASDWNPSNETTTLIMGLYSVPCTIESMEKHSGVLKMLNVDEDIRIEFIASRCYLEGKRFPVSKHLSQELNVGDFMCCHAVPCIEEESKYNCDWFAIEVFRNHRPLKMEPKNCYLNSSDDSDDTDVQPIPANVKSYWLRVISQRVRDSRTVFVRGHGTILKILNNDFAVILGSFSKNVFETILFHKKNAFLFKSSLGFSKLKEVFEEGDQMYFVAVAAPQNFFTKWIAIQVSVADFTSTNSDM